MWEQVTSACVGEITCRNDTYYWSNSAATYPEQVDREDGTLFLTFLAAMNGEASFGGNFTCYAGHCDWRIPSLNELRSLLAAGYPNCIIGGGPCVAPIFGATVASSYWSSTVFANNTLDAMFANFLDGNVSFATKSSQFYARAVRSAW